MCLAAALRAPWPRPHYDLRHVHILQAVEVDACRHEVMAAREAGRRAEQVVGAGGGWRRQRARMRTRTKHETLRPHSRQVMTSKSLHGMWCTTPRVLQGNSEYRNDTSPRSPRCGAAVWPPVPGRAPPLVGSCAGPARAAWAPQTWSHCWQSCVLGVQLRQHSNTAQRRC